MRVAVALRIVVVSLLTGLLATGCTSEPAPNTEPRYYIDSSETITQAEANRQPPVERWPPLRDLRDTDAIDVLCHPEGTAVRDPASVSKIVAALQASTYVAVGATPKDQPDIKVYFKRKDNTFIMAARVYLQEGVLESPEGPWIRANPQVVQMLVADGVCKSQ